MSEIQKVVPGEILEAYSNYMQVLRFMIAEGEIDFSKPVDQPKDVQIAWGNRAALGDAELGRALGLLARASEIAYKRRYLEDMPLLADFDSPYTPQDPDGNGFGAPTRFHFIRLFANDLRSLGSEDGELPSVPKALYMTPEVENSII